MSQPCRQPLKTNPFLTYRDPQTGRWQVIAANSAMSKGDRSENKALDPGLSDEQSAGSATATSDRP